MPTQYIHSPTPSHLQTVDVGASYVTGSLKVWANGLRLCFCEEVEPCVLCFIEVDSTSFMVNLGAGTQITSIIYEYEAV